MWACYYSDTIMENSSLQADFMYFTEDEKQFMQKVEIIQAQQ